MTGRSIFKKILATSAMFFFAVFAAHAQSSSGLAQIPGENSTSIENNPVKRAFTAGKDQSVFPAAGELDASFNANIDINPGDVRATALQADGKIIIAGYFKTLNGNVRRGIARINPDYSVDLTFAADINGTVFAVEVQMDGKIIIVGDFKSVNGVSRNQIARLNANGTLDTTFNLGIGADNPVYDAAVQPDGKILIAGSFYSVNSTASYLIARLNADGSFDTSFKSPYTPIFPPPASGAASVIYSIALQASGKIIIGGTPTLPRVNSNSTVTITSVMRLNIDGSNDFSFSAVSTNGTVEKVLVQPDDKILIGGSFVNVNGVSRGFIARLSADGAVDNSFNSGTGANLPIHSIYLKTDGKILISGDFRTFNNVQMRQIAQLNGDGSLDTIFNPSNSLLIGSVASVIGLANGQVLAAGSYLASFNGDRDSVSVFNPDGALDTSAVFTTSAIGSVRAIMPQIDGKTVVGGNFTRVNGVRNEDLARLNADGSPINQPTNGSFSSFSSFAGQVNSIVRQPDGKLLIAGLNISFPVNTGNGSLLRIGSIFRLNADYTFDETFTPGNIPTRRGINQIALQSDGKILVVWGYLLPNGIATGGIARLNADGSLDNSFSVGGAPNLLINSVVVQPDGKILISGPFSFSIVSSQTGTVSYNGVMRLNADGSHDAAFVPATISENNRFTIVCALTLQSDGKILVGGSLYTNGRTTPTGVVRLNIDGSLDAAFDSGTISGAFSGALDGTRVEDILPLPNGKILVGGLFSAIGTTARGNIALLNADGTIDHSFNASTDNTVYDLALQSDGRVLIGGDFEVVNGAPRTAVARLLSGLVISRRTPFDFDGDGRADVSVFRPDSGVWHLQLSQSGYAAAGFGFSTDKLVPADYDGDGKTDLTVFRENPSDPGKSNFYILQSSTNQLREEQFGATGDIPVSGDWDGDGKADIGVYRAGTQANPQGYFYYRPSSQPNVNFIPYPWGIAGDKPVVADYDGDGKADPAVFRPSNGGWYIQRSRDGFYAIQFGLAEDKPVVGDYDGDGKADQAVFRPSNGVWYVWRSRDGFAAAQFGVSTDKPVPADYDGDGKTDYAVYRDGNWFLLNSTNGFAALGFGNATDKPIPNAFVP